MRLRDVLRAPADLANAAATAAALRTSSTLLASPLLPVLHSRPDGI